MRAISFERVLIQDPAWCERIELIQKVTISDVLKKCYDSGRINNFKVAAGEAGDFQGIVYDDSDVYKLLEGIGYSLSQIKNEELESAADEVIKWISRAQEKSGYITTKFTIKGTGHFTNMNEHEMYNGGHLIEAGIAYAKGTGKRVLLDVGIRFADFLIREILPKVHWVPGHQEIELALIKLYEVTGAQAYYDAAVTLLENRGRGYGTKDITKHGYDWDKVYYQDTRPVSRIRKAEGHAVRSMYMMTAMAMAESYGTNIYGKALDSVWNNIISKNYYITGGIGSSVKNEGFQGDYNLPNETAYCETCASAGLLFWGSRMFLRRRDAVYHDLLERVIHNGLISGLSADGQHFFYDNVLESAGDKERSLWFKTSCCPSQLVRVLPSIGNYIYTEEEGILYINQYISSQIGDLTLCCNDLGTVSVNSRSSTYTRIALRIPFWAKSFSCTEQYTIQDGYLFTQAKEFTIHFHKDINFVKTNSKVKTNRGKVALLYGPTVYCLEYEDAENFDEFSFHADQCYLIHENTIKVVNKLSGHVEAILRPYYSWNNRGAQKMRVFFPYQSLDNLYYV